MASAPLRDLAFSLGLQPGHKSITPAMERAVRDFAAGLLRGLFDADGSVQGVARERRERAPRAGGRCDCCRPPSACCCAWASPLPIYRNRRPALTRLLPDGRGGQKAYPTRGFHELVISGDNLAFFADRIGFCRHRPRPRGWKMRSRATRAPSTANASSPPSNRCGTTAWRTSTT